MAWQMVFLDQLGSPVKPLGVADEEALELLARFRDKVAVVICHLALAIGTLVTPQAFQLGLLIEWMSRAVSFRCT